jgi:hypothetical protein
MSSKSSKTMNFSRLNYDQLAYKQSLAESTGPVNYLLSTPWRECEPCLSLDSRQPSGQGVSTCTSRSLVDIDSELQGISRKLTKASAECFKPSDAMKSCTASTAVVDCPQRATSEDTRLSNPPCTLRSTGWNRWEWLCQNPQDKVDVPFDFNVNSQLIAKDTHRPLVPIPVDPTPALPPPTNAAVLPGYPWCKGQSQPQPSANLPLVSWRACDDIAKY